MADAPRLYRVLHRISPPVVNRYLRLRLQGLEHVPVRAPAILASNHRSFLDSVVLPLNVPRPVYFLGKVDYWHSWRTRWFFEGTGVVPVHRQGGGRDEDGLRTGVAILRRGDLLGIYPEGTRSPDGRLYRGKTGPVRLALAADVPIIPCAVLGSAEALPPGARLPRRRPVTVRYGPPLDLSGHRGRHDDPGALRAATDELMAAIRGLSGQPYVDVYASEVKAGGGTGDVRGGASGRDGEAPDERAAS